MGVFIQRRYITGGHSLNLIIFKRVGPPPPENQRIQKTVKIFSQKVEFCKHIFQCISRENRNKI